MGLRRLIRNIKYLQKTDLEIKLERNYIESLIESLKYELVDDFRNLNVPVIKSVEDTIEHLKKSNSSICRFGDGELSLICNEDIPFQSASPLLSQRLIEVLTSNNENICIAIPRVCYYSKKNLTPINKNFWRSTEVRFRELMDKHINFSQTYFSAEMTLAYSYYQEYDYALYFKNIMDIWAERDVTIICGKSIFDTIEHNIFDTAKSVDYQYAPSLNAFEHYPDLLGTAKQIDKSRLIILILGPTAKVLAYDLGLLGYQALDLGHIAKSYDWFMKEKKINNISDAFNFFNPD